MPLMLVNGITLPVAFASLDVQGREIGAIGAAYSGLGNKSTWASPKSDLAFDTVFMVDSDAYPWIQMIRGMGEVWSYQVTNNLGAIVPTFYGSKGTPPVSTAGLSTSIAGTGFDGYRVVIAPGTNSFTVLFIPTRWTVSVWYWLGAGAVTNYVITSSGHKWVNGVRNDAASTTWLQNISGTSMKIAGDATLNTNVDDFVLLPYEIPDAWGPSFNSLALTYGFPYPALPIITVLGDVFNGAGRFFMGNVTNTAAVRTSGGVIRRKLTVSLTEV